MFRVVIGLCLPTRTSTTLHSLYQRNISYFSYPFYYTISTRRVVLILGGSWRKNFKVTHVRLLAEQPATCGLSLPIESGCGCISTLLNSCIFLMSASLYGSLYKIKTKSTNHCQSTTRYSDQLLAIQSQPL